ncbi:MAG: site-2 protease family protein, partial [Gammaproteobacteria bacterium]|nr:site-2 protease family protein [Gammaproteobacteria bacterium]
MEYIKDILALIVTISILVTVHEWGHYFVARLCGVRVLRFSVGFGTPLLSYRGKPAAHEAPAETGLGTRTNEPDEGTEFVIAAIPLGGYVKMLDEREGYVADDQLHLAFNRKPVLQRIAIVLAGPFANFLLAVLAYWILFTVGVNGLAPVLGHVESGSPADRAGLQQGQEILSIDGEPVTTWSQANLALFNRLGETGEIQLQAGSPGESRGQAYRIPIDEWLRGVETPAPAESLGMRHYPTVAPVIEAIVADGRAEQAGLLKGDRILAVNGEPVEYWFELERSIQAHPEKTMVLRVLRGGGEL